MQEQAWHHEDVGKTHTPAARRCRKYLKPTL